MMRFPVIQGLIERRILVNYRVDAAIMARHLPRPFRPKLVRGHAIAGICLIRLGRIRPRGLPLPMGWRSENAAHRIAVEWQDQDGLQEGVFIPRRDTSSWLNAWVGGRLFPGLHHHANFDVEESDGYYGVSLCSHDAGSHDAGSRGAGSGDGQTRIQVLGRVTARWPSDSVFDSLAQASDFFERGSLGYSSTRTPGRFDGLELRCENWNVESLAVDKVESSYFGDVQHFPEGSVTFDNALLMQDIRHTWHGRKDLVAAAEESQGAGGRRTK